VITKLRLDGAGARSGRRPGNLTGHAVTWFRDYEMRLLAAERNAGALSAVPSISYSVGKVKRPIPRGESRKLVNTEAMQLMQTLVPRGQMASTDQYENEIVGPALELDILAIYR
jgi:hypothetical protein